MKLVFFCAHLPSVLLLLRQGLQKSRFAAGNGLGTGLGTTISNVRACSLKATTFKSCHQQRVFGAGISFTMFFEVGLRQSSPSLSSTPLFSCSCRCSQHPNKCQQDKARQWLKCHPQRRGNRLELAGGTSPREFPCHCTDEAGKPSKARRGFVPSVSHRRRFLSLSSARSGCAQVQRDCSTSRKGVLVLWATTFKFCRQQLNFQPPSAHQCFAGFDRGRCDCFNTPAQSC